MVGGDSFCYLLVVSAIQIKERKHSLLVYENFSLYNRIFNHSYTLTCQDNDFEKTTGFGLFISKVLQNLMMVEYGCRITKIIKWDLRSISVYH
jgi:hypothetical protein